MDLGQPVMTVPTLIAESLYPLHAYHFLGSRVYRVARHMPDEEIPTMTRVTSNLVLQSDSGVVHWVEQLILAEVAALRAAVLDECPAYFRAHLLVLEPAIRWLSYRQPGTRRLATESAFRELLVVLHGSTPNAAVSPINRLTASLRSNQ